MTEHAFHEHLARQIADKLKRRRIVIWCLVPSISASPAVKAALRAFADAPAPGRGGRGKKGA